MKYVKWLFLAMLLSLTATVVWAGDIDAPGGPTDENSAMYTITDVYNRINDGAAGTKRTTTFGEPTAAPGDTTTPTLTDLYVLASERSRPAKTGQTSTVPYAAPAGSDGALEKGVAWPSTRFSEPDPADGTVTDNLTGLIWLKAANYNTTGGGTGTATWTNALSSAMPLRAGNAASRMVLPPGTGACPMLKSC